MYLFEGKYEKLEAGGVIEVIKRSVTIEEQFCKNDGEAFMFASAELYNMCSENEDMVSVELIAK